MANITDYLRWRGDLSFSERPFNDVDNVVLSALACLDFSGIAPKDEEAHVTLGDACRELLKRSNGDVGPYVRSLAKVDAAFVETLSSAERFAKARLSHYVDVVDESRSLQFAALLVTLPGSDAYVAFRGTDDTLVGWRENLMLSYEVTAAQKEATAYLELVVPQIDAAAGKVMVGGHSKGGNLAEFASRMCTPETSARIDRVYSNDGPGIDPVVVPRHKLANLGERFRRIVPAYSVVGMLYAFEKPQLVVASDERGVAQHDLMSWRVERDAMEKAPEGLDEDSVTMSRVLRDWITGLSFRERRRCVDEIFDALGAGGAEHLDEIASSPEHLQDVLRAVAGTDEHTRDIVLMLVQGAASASVETARKSVSRAVKDARKLLFGT